MRPRFASLPGFPASLLPCLLLCALPAPGLDIAGTLVDKLKAPIPQAEVCLKSNPSRCASSDAEGRFHITDGVSAGFKPSRTPVTLELKGGRMVLTVPAATTARIVWHDASGRSLAPARTAGLAAGRNLLDLPAPRPGGLRLLRVSMPGASITWKAILLDPGKADADKADRGHAWSALSKPSAALSDLVVRKDGYRPETYRPRQEVESGVVIVLTALSDSGFKYTSVFKARNVALDRALGRWITESTVDTCKETTPVKTLVLDTARFAIRDGKLIQWKEGQCVGEVLTGGGADVAGTWSLSESDVFLPEDLRSAGCRDTIPSSQVPEIVDGRLSITEADQTLELTVEVCPPDIYLPLIDLYLMSDSTTSLTANTCRRLVFRNAAAEEAVIVFEKRGDSLASTFTHKSSTCKGVELMRQGEGVVLTCTGNDPAFDFLDCIAGTGFFGDVPGRAFIFPRHDRTHSQSR